MAKFSVDVQEIKNELKTRALQAAADLSELAKRAQKDFSQEKVMKKVDEVMTIVKAQEFMKNPKIAELAARIVTLSGQIEKTMKTQVAPLVEEMRARVKGATPTKTTKKKKTTTKK